MATPPPSWEDVAWLRSLVPGPFMVKGVGRPDDARRAADAGASAVSVSNHGGNNLDSTPGGDCASCRPSPPRSATASRSCSTAACGAGRTWPRRWPWARAR